MREPVSIWCRSLEAFDGGSLTSVELPSFLINVVDGKFVIEDDVRQTGGHCREWSILIEGEVDHF